MAFPVFFVSRPSHEEPPQKTVWRFKFFFWVDLPTHNFPENHVAFQVFFCESTFPPTTFPENHVACQVLLRVDLCNKNLPRKPCGMSTSFASRPPQQEPSQKTMRRFNSFLWVDLRTPNLPRKPCGVSNIFCGSTFAPQNRPREPCGISSFLCESTFHLEPSQKTIWRFTVFLRIDLPAKNLPIWRFNFVESTFTTRTFPENHAAFQFFWVDLRTRKPPKP